VSVRDLSIVDWPFRAALIAGVVVALASSWWFRWWLWRWAARLLALVLAVASVGAAINAHYFYFPTLGALLGRRAADQVSAAAFNQMEQQYVHLRRQLGTGQLPAHGVVLSFAMPGTVSHFPARTGQVYLPPVYFLHPHPRLPVIELLHGSPGSPTDWTRAAFADLTADGYASTHDGFAPILVMPDVNGRKWWNDSECVDGPRGLAETYLTVDVRNAVIARFDARSDGAAWAIAGLSEGGSCALQIGLRHARDYGTVGDFSGDDHPSVASGIRHLFWGATLADVMAAERAYDPRVLLANWHGDGPAIMFCVGSHDHLIAKTRHLYALALTHGLDARLRILNGGHTFRFWGDSFNDALPWMTTRLSHEPRLVTHHRRSPGHRTPAGA
jgi:S-formylglutathione hydrolase FrmB